MRYRIKIILGYDAEDAEKKSNEFLSTIHRDNIIKVEFDCQPKAFIIYISYQQS